MCTVSIVHSDTGGQRTGVCTVQCDTGGQVYIRTLKPLYYGHFGTLILVLITEVSSIQRSLNILQY